MVKKGNNFVEDVYISEFFKWEWFGMMIYNKWDRKIFNKSLCRYLKEIF